MPLSTSPGPLSWLENLIATQRDEAGGTWRALTNGDQAIVLLVYLAKGDTFAQLGGHFGIGPETARRYVNEGLQALAPLAPTLADGLDAAGPERRLLLDSTLIPTWRCAALATEANGDPLYNSKHRDHGMTVQALTDTTGELVFLGEARPGATHDLTGARTDGIVEAVTDADIETTADSGYQGAGGCVRIPIKRPAGKGHNGWEKAGEHRPG
ncbi:transposase family protein [Streptomyces sp. ESR1.13]|uniref:transposase family protein n=1 Tax=unclassified Streptomyces TaxID=2593676 RepID=UPI0040434CEE